MSLDNRHVENTSPTPLGTLETRLKAASMQSMTLRHIRPEDITTEGQMVRESQNDDHVIELATSISRHGLLEPIVVEETRPGAYQLIAGFHRLAAITRLGWPQIPANVRTPQSDVPVKSLALVENICRRDMSLSEEVEAVAHLHDVDKLSPSQICQIVGKSRAWVDRRLAMPNIDPEVMAACFDNLISLGMAETLSRVEDEGIRRQILNEAVYGRRTLSQVKDLIKLYEETPSMENAIQEGMDTATQQQETQQHTKRCAACGTDRPLHQLANFWACASGCVSDGDSQEANPGDVQGEPEK